MQVSKKQAEILYEFFSSYLAWSQTMLSNVDYRGGTGLCHNLESRFLGYRDPWGVIPLFDAYIGRDFGYEEDEDGVKHSLDYPFGKEEYFKYGNTETMHKCPKRIAWVKKMIAELEMVISLNKD